MKDWLTLALLSLAWVGCGTNPVLITPAAQAPATNLTNNVIFIGDSITLLWSQQPEFEASTNWVDKGVSGQTSTLIAMRFKKDVIDLHPKEVHILAGTNDVSEDWRLCKIHSGAATDAAPPSIQALDHPPDTCTNMLYMVETAKRSGIKVIIGTIPPWGCYNNSSCYQTREDQSRYSRIAELNTWLKRFAAIEDVEIIDYHSLLTDSQQMHYGQGLTNDGVHPNAQGYIQMTAAASAALR